MTAALALNADTFSALGEPNRLRMVELLRHGPRAVGEMAETLGIRQPQVSKHLKVLGEAGLVSVEAVARRRIYRLEPAPFAAMAHWVDSFEALWSQRMDAMGDVLASLDDA